MPAKRVYKFVYCPEGELTAVRKGKLVAHASICCTMHSEFFAELRLRKITWLKGVAVWIVRL